MVQVRFSYVLEEPRNALLVMYELFFEKFRDNFIGIERKTYTFTRSFTSFICFRELKEFLIMKIIICLLMFCAVSCIDVEAQDVGDENVKYRRSSLHFVLLDIDDFPDKETIFKAYKTYPFPEKYNDHRVDEIKLDLRAFKLTEEDRKALGLEKDKAAQAAQALKQAGSALLNKRMSEIEDLSEVSYMLEKAIRETRLTNKLLAKWFNRDLEDGTFNMDLIHDRGLYDVSQQGISKAEKIF